MSNLCHLFHILLVLWTIPDAFGQSATLGGTNFVTGRGFCFGDQQLTQGPPVITCDVTGYTGSPPVAVASASWFINGNTAITTGGVAALYPGRLQGIDLGAAGHHLEVLNVTVADSGVTSVACRLVALDTNNNLLFQTDQTAAENIEGAVSSVPAPNITKVTPSGNQMMVSVSRPSGLCTAFTVSGYQYTVYRSADDVVVMNTTSSDNPATLTDLVLETQYRLEVQAVVEVISQSMVAIRNFTTTNETSTTNMPSAAPPALPTGFILGIVVGVVLLFLLSTLIIVVCLIIYYCCCRSNSIKARSDAMLMPERGGEKRDSVIYDHVDQDPYSHVKMDKNPVYETTGTAVVLDKNPAYENTS